MMTNNCNIKGEHRLLIYFVLILWPLVVLSKLTENCNSHGVFRICSTKHRPLSAWFLQPAGGVTPPLFQNFSYTQLCVHLRIYGCVYLWFTCAHIHRSVHSPYTCVYLHIHTYACSRYLRKYIKNCCLFRHLSKKTWKNPNLENIKFRSNNSKLEGSSPDPAHPLMSPAWYSGRSPNDCQLSCVALLLRCPILAPKKCQGW